MAAYAFTPVSIGGKPLTGAPFNWVGFLEGNSPLSTGGADAVMASIVGRGSQYVRSQPVSVVWRMRVALQDLNESSLKTMRSTCRTSDGLVYLRVTDGDGTVWRCPVAVRRLEEVNPVTWDAVLDVPLPVWEEDAVNTDNAHLNVTTQTVTLGAGSLANDGDMDCGAVFTYTADAAKNTPAILDDTVFSFRTFFVNRAPFGLSNWPVWLCDQNGVQARLSVASAASGAAVQRTDISNQINLGGGITAVATTIAVDTAVGGGLPATGGLAYIIDGVNGDEQIYYTANGGGNLTGVVRGIGGTAAVIHPDNAVIRYSTLLRNGDDVRVWYNDNPNYPRYLCGNGAAAHNNWNGTACDIVIPVTCDAGRSYTPVGSVTNAVPATGGTLTVKESLAAEPLRGGFIAWDSEVVYYSTRDDHTLYGIVRACWGTTAASHNPATSLVYGNPQRIIVGAGWAKAGAPNAALSGRPCPQLNASSNSVLKYGDQADDASTIYYDPAQPGRGAQWAPGFDLDGNTVAPLMSLAAYGNIITFKDDVPGDGAPPYNNLELTVPMGLKVGDASAIKNDWYPLPSYLNSELFVRDSAGTLKLIDQLQSPNIAYGTAQTLNGAITASATAIVTSGTACANGDIILVDYELMLVTAGGGTSNLTVVRGYHNTTAVSHVTASHVSKLAPALARTLSATLAPNGLLSTAYGVKLKCRYNIAYGIDGFDTVGVVSADNGGATSGVAISGTAAIKLTIASDVFINVLRVKCRLVSAGANTGQVQVWGDNNGVPSGVLIMGSMNPISVGSTTPVFVDIVLSKGQMFRAGTYWIEFQRNTPASPAIQFIGRSGVGGGGFLNYDQSHYDGANWGTTHTTAGLIHVIAAYDNSGNAIIGSDQPVLTGGSTWDKRTGLTASFDKTELILNPSQSVYVHRNTGFVAGATAGSMYHLKDTLQNTATGDEIAIDKWMSPGSTFEIDTDQQTVTYLEDAIAYAVTKAINPADETAWLTLVPGNNVVTSTDPSRAATGQIDIVTAWRGRRS